MQPLGRSSSSSMKPVFQPEYSLPLRAVYLLQLWILKITILCFFKVFKRFNSTAIEERPSFIKFYPSCPDLGQRIFVPRSYKDGQKLPLYLSAHGGGLTLMAAEIDDEVCSRLANQFNVLVASLEFRLAPRYKFPKQINEVITTAQDIINDPILPVDKDRVMLGGFSAGGTLMMAAAQMPVLRSIVKGVVAWYPPMDYQISLKDRQASRPYRHAKDTDDLQNWGAVFNFGYIPPGTNLKDPFLSPRFASAKDLPDWIYLVGAEYDMMADEARQTAFDLADLSEKDREAGKYEFEKGTYKWTLVRGVRHAFTHYTMDKAGPDETLRIEKLEDVIQQVGQWLHRGPFATGSKTAG